MIALRIKEAAEILGYGGKVFDGEIYEVSTDSRKVDTKTAFIALKGEKFDGHDFIEEVLAKGVPLVIAERVPDGVDATRVIVVKDTVEALGMLARHNRRQFKGKVIALTGSSGKTTTKEELKMMLSSFGRTCATAGNFNNHIGVPRSLLDLDMAADYAVIEMGMSARGEIEYLTSLAEPDVAVVTNVYPMHIEFLGSLENIAKAKAEIFSGLRAGGIAVYNEDTAYADILQREAQKYAKKVYGFGKENHRAAEQKQEDEAEHCYYNAWCVLEVAAALGLDINKAAAAISGFAAPEGRGKKHYLDIEGKKALLINDSYSGQPEAVKFAVRALGRLKIMGKKIAVIGKMAELGAYSTQAHIEVGKELREALIDVVFGVGEETKDMLNELPESVEKHYFPEVTGVYEALCGILSDGDAVLIKGAHYSSKVYTVADKLILFEKLA